MPGTESAAKTGCLQTFGRLGELHALAVDVEKNGLGVVWHIIMHHRRIAVTFDVLVQALVRHTPDSVAESIRRIWVQHLALESLYCCNAVSVAAEINESIAETCPRPEIRWHVHEIVTLVETMAIQDFEEPGTGATDGQIPDDHTCPVRRADVVDRVCSVNVAFGLSPRRCGLSCVLSAAILGEEMDDALPMSSSFWCRVVSPI